MIIDIYNHFIPRALFERLGDLIPGHVATTAFRRVPTAAEQARVLSGNARDLLKLP